MSDNHRFLPPGPLGFGSGRIGNHYQVVSGQRSAKGDMEWNYCRHWLLFVLLEDISLFAPVVSPSEEELSRVARDE